MNHFWLFATKIEHFLFKLAALLLLLLCLGQMALRSAVLRPYLNPVELLEGIPYRLPEETNSTDTR